MAVRKTKAPKGSAHQNDSTEERFAVAEPHPFSTPDVLREAYCEGKRDYWNGYRDRVLRQNGFPIPYHQYDVLDEKAGPAARADFAGFLREAGTREPFDVLSSLMSGGRRGQRFLARSRDRCSHHSHADVRPLSHRKGAVRPAPSAIQRSSTRPAEHRDPSRSHQAGSSVARRSGAHAAPAKRRLALVGHRAHRAVFD